VENPRCDFLTEKFALTNGHQLPQKVYAPPKLPYGTLKCNLNDAAVRLWHGSTVSIA